MRRAWVESGEVWTANDRGIIWHGRPEGYSALSLVEIPGTEDYVVLLDAQSGPRNPLGDLTGWAHLVRVSMDGKVQWRAEPGTPLGDKDWWTSLSMRNGRLLAHTYSGYLKILDPATGLVLSSEFVK